jgi:hypothetical protein
MNKLKQWWCSLGDKQILFFIAIGGVIFLLEILLLSHIAESCFD